jgi:transcriptional regulator with XRE-family HTH domain
MKSSIPSASDIRASLNQLRHAGLQRLAKDSGVSFSTLWRIREGMTDNPGLLTVNKLLPHIAALKQAA